MVDSRASTDARAGREDTWPPSLRALAARHRVASAVLLVLAAMFVAIVVPEVLSAGKLKVTDSTPCSAWSSAKPDQQAAYARLYLGLHRSLPNGTRGAGSVLDAVNYGCIQAYSFDEGDSITVLQAIKRQY